MALPRDLQTSQPRPQTIADQQERGILQLAWGHAISRNARVARVFCYISVMRAAGLIARPATVLVSPESLRVPQDFQATGGNEAAHYLPGFIAIGSHPQDKKARYLWDLVNDPAVREDIAGLFRATQDLPASFNQADSAAEARQKLAPPALKQVFGYCCQLIVNADVPRAPDTGEARILVDRPLVTRAYHEWAQGSIAAYLAAAVRKGKRIAQGRPADVPVAPAHDPLHGRVWTGEGIAARMRDQQRTVRDAKATVAEFSDQESFLRAYARVTNAEVPLSEAVIQQIEGPFQPQMPAWYSRY